MHILAGKKRRKLPFRSPPRSIDDGDFPNPPLRLPDSPGDLVHRPHVTSVAGNAIDDSIATGRPRY